MASQKWFENFYQQSTTECDSDDGSEINTFYYHPHHKSKQDFKICAIVQQIHQKNCIRFAFNVSENTSWYTLRDAIEVVYYLLDTTRIKSSNIGKLNYKDFDPYLFKDNVKKGGYTRQCTDYWDRKIFGPNGKQIKRRKVPRILVTKHDEQLYESLPDEQRKYKLFYRGNYYAAIDDYLHNHSVIDDYNEKNNKKELYVKMLSVLYHSLLKF